MKQFPRSSNETLQNCPNMNYDRIIRPSSNITRIADQFFAVRFEGDDCFDEFLMGGGAKTWDEIIDFLSDKLHVKIKPRSISNLSCSTISVADKMKRRLFGRNLDWDYFNALVIESKPIHGYASISTVNLEVFEVEEEIYPKSRLDEILTRALLFAPVDGMNEKGFAIALLMIQDDVTVNQKTGKPGLTFFTAIRLLLNKASCVKEALSLLEQYDMHGAEGMMLHLSMTDITGRSVAVEYIDNKMSVVEAYAVTNFYLTPGEKYGIGTVQSQKRYERLINRIVKLGRMNRFQVRDVLESVGQRSMGGSSSTEWSIVFRQNEGLADYYHREDYTRRYTFSIFC